jgi:NAD-dependent deacetylase
MSSTPAEISENINLAVELIKQSHHTIALTGAGISTHSGIPDFRSPGIGLWTQVQPMEVASLSSFRYNPEQFYRWFRPLALQIYTAEPNAAHVALAKLQAHGYLSTIITQNIDGLHTRAGSEKVLEVHGSLYTLTCTNCYRQIQSSQIMEDYLNNCTIPYCQACGSIMKPDVILYEEQLPVKTWSMAEEEARKCDLVLTVGTSLEVLPSAKLPVQAMDHGAHLIIINHTETFMDVRADAVIQADVVEILPQIASGVLGV